MGSEVRVTDRWQKGSEIRVTDRWSMGSDIRERSETADDWREVKLEWEVRQQMTKGKWI